MGAEPQLKTDLFLDEAYGNPEKVYFSDPAMIVPSSKEPYWRGMPQEDEMASPNEDTEEAIDNKIKNLVAKPKIYTSRPPDFLVLQKWEGVVQTISEEAFTAILVDLTEESEKEYAEFFLDDVVPSDKGLLKPGAVFYCCVGYAISESGQRTRGTQLRFRRLPAWGKRDILKAEKEAEAINKEIGWYDPIE
ncbi:MAG: hypothetical protein ACE5GQ_09265 [Nitrospinales bacterium]